jgi:hypothetical protein
MIDMRRDVGDPPALTFFKDFSKPLRDSELRPTRIVPKGLTVPVFAP